MAKSQAPFLQCIVLSSYPMWKDKKEEDYFIPPLAPYVKWVGAYHQLVRRLYEEHKTVRKAWRGFMRAIPELEGRLEFGVFEQILLFSLFLSEWEKYEPRPDERLEQVIQKLTDERDRAVLKAKIHERNELELKDRKELLEKQAAGLTRELQVLRNQLDAASKRLDMVTQELDENRAEVESLKRQKPAVVIQKSGVLKVGRWNAQISRDGYYRLFRKIGGKLHSIYIGKELDIEKAKLRIAEKESELLATDKTP